MCVESIISKRFNHFLVEFFITNRLSFESNNKLSLGKRLEPYNTYWWGYHHPLMTLKISNVSYSCVMYLICTTNKTLNYAYWNDRTVLDHQTFEPKLKSTQLNIHKLNINHDIMNRNSLIPNWHTTHKTHNEKETSSKWLKSKHSNIEIEKYIIIQWWYKSKMNNNIYYKRKEFKVFKGYKLRHNI